MFDCWVRWLKDDIIWYLSIYRYVYIYTYIYIYTCRLFTIFQCYLDKNWLYLWIYVCVYVFFVVSIYIYWVHKKNITFTKERVGDGKMADSVIEKPKAQTLLSTFVWCSMPSRIMIPIGSHPLMISFVQCKKKKLTHFPGTVPTKISETIRDHIPLPVLSGTVLVNFLW